MDNKYVKWVLELTNQEYNGDNRLCNANIALYLNVK